mgnify:CR=1 FL=1
MTGPIKSLDARYYTDPEVFKLETGGLLARTWQFGCHASELANTGDYATFEIAGESLFNDGVGYVVYLVLVAIAPLAVNTTTATQETCQSSAADDTTTVTLYSAHCSKSMAAPVANVNCPDVGCRSSGFPRSRAQFPTVDGVVPNA